MSEAAGFAETGYAILPSHLDDATLDRLSGLIDRSVSGGAGARTFASDDTLEGLVGPAGPLTGLAARLMERPMRLARVLLFDKTPGRNWAVSWHQDRAIAVETRVETPGFDHWTRKGGVDHVEPPEDLLAGMVALRLHLDHCPAENGALEVMPGSWRLGRLPEAELHEHIAAGAAVICAVARGDIVAMRGLTLHASKPSARPGHRRVLHVDFADRDLPGGLNWLSLSAAARP